MQIKHGYIKLLSQVLIFFYFENLEFFFKVTRYKFWILKPDYMLVYISTKFQVTICKNSGGLPFWMPRRPLFTLFTSILEFSYFQFFPRFGLFKNCSRVIFAFLRKIWHKNMHRTTQTRFGLRPRFCCQIPALDATDFIKLFFWIRKRQIVLLTELWNVTINPDVVLCQLKVSQVRGHLISYATCR